MLHIIQARDKANQALKYAAQDDAFVLMGEACYLLFNTDFCELMAKHELYVLESDMQAYALPKRQDVTQIAYADFVELTAQHEQSLTWSL